MLTDESVYTLITSSTPMQTVIALEMSCLNKYVMTTENSKSGQTILYLEISQLCVNILRASIYPTTRT